MVAYDVGEGRVLDVRLYAQEVIEAFVALGLLRGLAGGEHGCELGSQAVGVDHLALGIARMHANTLDVDLC